MSSSTATPASKPKIAYAIFDMDGTLIDTETIYTKVTNDILARFGLSMSWEVKSGMMGKPALVAAQYLFDAFPPGSFPPEYTPQAYVDERNALQDASFRVVQPLPGAVELLERLIAANIPIALATGSTVEGVALKTSHLDIFKNFHPHVLTSNSPPVPPATQTTKGKPHPDIFLAAARSLGFAVGTEEEPASEAERAERARGLVFEDALPGVEAGVRSGMQVCWIPDQELSKLHPGDDKGAHQVLHTLEGFDLSIWGL